MNMEDSQFSPASPQRRFNTRLGLILFAFYSLLYLGFVLISALATDMMEITVVAGLNLAIVYGFGLIFAAFVLAMAYGLLCKTETTPPSQEDVQ
ncbi:hypothetical protein LF1_42370 [Rubripirellula obstinata]|uniref:DUF485 domain-containing protein n=1 Tax=Rubripirellula obstinata TaxID=406547 RepID=A0A5B1CMU5_9BACT|nr:DUF485 domain-containing protein [Rubripirellula obstinata]KAA1261682.1 hypothetical protein LF1_42370 [Rubripirellula obstinata]